MDKKDLEVIDDMIGALDQSDKWGRIVKADPLINRSYSKLDAILNQYPEAVREAVFDYEGDIARAAMLYGMWVMCLLNDVLSDPAQLSQRILDRMEGRI